MHLQRCYTVEISSGSVWFERAYGTVEETVFNATLIELNIGLYKIVKIPRFILEIFTWAPNEGIRVFFNGSYRMCDFRRFEGMGPFGAAAFKAVHTFSNLTLTCPVPPNMYYATIKADFLSRVAPIRLFYQPNRVLVIQVSVGELNSPGNFTKRGFGSITLAFKKNC